MKYSCIGEWFDDNSDAHEEKELVESGIFQPEQVCETVLDQYSCIDVDRKKSGSPTSPLVRARLSPDVTQQNESTSERKCIPYALKQAGCLISMLFVSFFFSSRNCIHETIGTTG